MRMRKNKNFLVCPGGGKSYKKKSLTNCWIYAIIIPERKRKE